jgi:endonuclease/exonuclease/phosphatase family metal-dependent hydrolase
VIALQEVQPRQARALGRRLRSATVHWSFKHWPIRQPAEGLAILSPHRLHDAHTVVLSRGQPPWTYRRRIAQIGAVDLRGRGLHLANCHLASDDADERQAQAERLLARLEPGTVVTGDLNARPGSETLALLIGAGLRDSGAGAPATNWRRSDPDDEPSNRLDYILVPRGFRVIGAAVPSAADSDLTAYRRLSDHLPVRAELELLRGAS